MDAKFVLERAIASQLKGHAMETAIAGFTALVIDDPLAGDVSIPAGAYIYAHGFAEGMKEGARIAERTCHLADHGDSA